MLCCMPSMNRRMELREAGQWRARTQSCRKVVVTVSLHLEIGFAYKRRKTGIQDVIKVILDRRRRPHQMIAHDKPKLPPRLAALPLEAFAPPDAWIIDGADLGSADYLQLYVAAEQIGDAHAEFLQNPASAKALPFSHRADILFLLIDAVVLAVCAKTHKLAGVFAIAYQSCFPPTGGWASGAIFTS